LDGVERLLVNNFPAQLAPDGSWSVTIDVRQGDNLVRFSVLDKKGNKMDKDYSVVGDVSLGAAAGGIAALTATPGKYYALIIAVDEYDDPEIADLDKPIHDAEALKSILTENYTFDEENVTFLPNATRAEIIDAMVDMRKKVTENDNFLMFYAGHGYYDEASNIGYWIPSDGRKSSTSDWFRNSSLTDEIGAIKSKHTLLIADACFSGAIFKTRKAFSDASVAINKLYELPSRKGMTSGSLTEVPDRSAFISYLQKRLKSNSEKYLTSEQLFTSIRIAVINNSDVIPMYGTLQKVGDEGGDFIFIRRD
jgi:hypothetical protein